MANNIDDRERRRTIPVVREVPVYDWDSLRRAFGEDSDERLRRRSLLRVVYERVDRWLGRRVVSSMSEADLHRLAYLLGISDLDPDREDGEL